MADLKEVLAISPIFRGLSAQHIDALIRSARIERFAADQTIWNEGDKPDRLALIIKGDVDASLGDTLREIVSSESRGGVIGAGLVLDLPNEFSIVADRETTAGSWDEKAIRRAEFQAPGLRTQLSVRLSKLTRMAELGEILQHAPLFRSSSAVLRHRLLQEMTLVQFLVDQPIFQAGDPATSCYLVVRGEVEVRSSETGSTEKVTILGRGSLFGDIDLLTTGKHTESAKAASDVELLAIHRIDIEALRRACGSFRRTITARIGSAAGSTKPQDLILVVNRTPFSAPAVAGLIPSAFEDLGELNVGLLEVAPEGASGQGDDVLRLPSGDPKRAIQLLQERARRMGHRYVIIYTTAKNALEWLTEPVWDKIIDNLVSSAVYFTDDLQRAFPIETPQLSPVQYVELRPASAPKPKGMVRSGSIRLVVDGGPGTDPRYEALPEANRTALRRLARTLSHQVVGLALGGGAAWGYAHIPLIFALHDAGIPIDMVSGTSIGAAIAVTYGGRGLDGLSAFLENSNALALSLAFAPFFRIPWERVIRKIMQGDLNLEDFPLPTLPVAVDILTGRPRVFRYGKAMNAALASAAIPGVLMPELQDGSRFVDGGIANNVPVSVLVEEGADFIIASNVIPPPVRLQRVKHKSSVGRVLSQLSPLGRLQDSLRGTFLLMHDTGVRQANAAQITLTPALGSFGPLDFHAGRKIAEHVKPTLPPFIDQVKELYRSFCRNRDY